MTNQHYVPQFLLRNFASSVSEKQIYVFDKAKERSFSSSINKVSSARAFYDFEVDGVSGSIDPLLSKLENVTSGVIRRIIQARTLRGLHANDRMLVALFASVQMLRTEAQRKATKALIDNVHDAVKRRGWNPNKVEGFKFLTEDQVRVESITSLRERAAGLAPEFLNKYWVLYRTRKEHPFYVSDNPVALFNLKRDPVRSMLGLRVPGIQIYLPVSSTLCLGFLCPSIRLPLRIRFLGKPFSLTPANVDHFNSLQVSNAERFVLSHSDNFGLVREMLDAGFPEFRTGPRWR